MAAILIVAAFSSPNQSATQMTRFLKKPMKGAFIAGGFFFTKSDFIKEVPYDPNLYFIGEEISLGVRAYTHGWDVYYPNKVVIYHNYTPAGTPGPQNPFQRSQQMG